MENTRKSDRSFEALAWGALFVWWGITELVNTLPSGTGLIGVALILLALNAARYLSGVPVSGFTATLGILVLIWGGLELAGAFMSLPFDLPVFAILLIVLGAITLIRELAGAKSSGQEA